MNELKDIAFIQFAYGSVMPITKISIQVIRIFGVAHYLLLE
jgi:hypothetical protein